MPRQKKASRGGGHPCGAYSELSSEEKKEYHRRKAAQAYTKAAESTSASHEEPRPVVGRPPIMDSAMSPNTLKRRKRQLTADKRHSDSVRKVKQKAASMRWQFEYMDSKAPNESESGPSSGQVEVHKEVEASQPTIIPSSRTIFHLKARLIGLLPSHPIDHLDLFIMSLPSFPAAAILDTKKL